MEKKGGGRFGGRGFRFSCWVEMNQIKIDNSSLRTSISGIENMLPGPRKVTF